MKIICAGVGKTGTKSIAKALRHLGLTVFDWEEQTFDFQDHWVDVFQNGAQLDVKRVYQHADAIVDAPEIFSGRKYWKLTLIVKLKFKRKRRRFLVEECGQSSSSHRGSDISQVFVCSLSDFKKTVLCYIFCYKRSSWLCKPQVSFYLA